MDVIRLGKKGQLSLPAAVVLRAAAVYPVEVYTEARLKEFEESHRTTAAEAARVRKALARRKR